MKIRMVEDGYGWKDRGWADGGRGRIDIGISLENFTSPNR